MKAKIILVGAALALVALYFCGAMAAPSCVAGSAESLFTDCIQR